MQPINNLPIALPGPGMQSHVVYITIYHHRLNRLDFEDCIVLVVVVAAVVSLVKDLYYTWVCMRVFCMGWRTLLVQRVNWYWMVWLDASIELIDHQRNWRRTGREKRVVYSSILVHLDAVVGLEVVAYPAECRRRGQRQGPCQGRHIVAEVEAAWRTSLFILSSPLTSKQRWAIKIGSFRFTTIRASLDLHAVSRVRLVLLVVVVVDTLVIIQVIYLYGLDGKYYGHNHFRASKHRNTKESNIRIGHTKNRSYWNDSMRPQGHFHILIQSLQSQNLLGI